MQKPICRGATVAVLFLLMLAACGQAPEQTLYVIAIGVNQYDRPGFQALAYARKAAEQVADALQKTNANKTVIRLFFSDHPDPQRRPTPTNVITALADITAHATDHDRFLLFFCGHGIEAIGANGQPTPYLLLKEAASLTNRTILDLNSLDLYKLQGIVNELPCKTRVLILDMCRDPVEVTGGGKSALPRPAYERAKNTTIYSCSVGQSAKYNRDTGTSYFSEALIEAMKGNPAAIDAKTNAITVRSLFDYVSGHIGIPAQKPAIDNSTNASLIAFPTFGSAAFDGKHGKSLANTLQGNLITLGQLRFVERGSLDKVLAEQKLESIGITDIETVKRIGKIANVDYLLVGAEEEYYDALKFDVRVIRVADGTILDKCASSASLKLSEVTAAKVDQLLKRMALELHLTILDALGWVDLDRNVGRLVLTTEPAHATVTLTPAGEGEDGNYLFKFDDNAAMRQVLVTADADGYETTTATVPIDKGALVPYTLTLKEKPGLLTVASVPPDADVDAEGVTGKTPCTLALPMKGQAERPVTLTLIREGYESVTQTVTVKRAGTVAPAAVALPPRPCLLTVKVNLPDAVVTVLDQDFPTQRPPAAGGAFILPMRGRTHPRVDIRVEREGYQTIEQTETLLPGQAITREIVLTELPGTLLVTSDIPNAIVYLDGTAQQARTPATIPVPMRGQHKLTCTVRGQLDGGDAGPVQTVTVERGKTTTVHLSVPAITVSLSVQSIPPGAGVALNGTALADKVTPCTVHVEPALEGKTVTVRLTLPGYRTKDVPCLVARGNVALPAVKLDPLPPGTLTVTANLPKVKIFLDSVAQPGYAPLTLTVPMRDDQPRTCQVVGQPDGDDPSAAQTIAVASGATVPVELAFPDTLTLATEPAGARVFLNGVEQGIAPLRRLTLTPALIGKTLTIACEAPDCLRTEITYTPVRGRNALPTIVLSPLPTLTITTNDPHAAMQAVNTETKQVYALVSGEAKRLPPGAYAVTVSGDKSVSWQERLTLKEQDALTRAVHLTDGPIRLDDAAGLLAMSGDGTLLVGADAEKRLRCWDLGQRTLLRTLEPLKVEVLKSLALSADGSVLIANGSRVLVPGEQPRGMVKALNLRGEELAVVQFTRECQAVCLTPDNSACVIVEWDGAIRLYDLARLKPLKNADTRLQVKRDGGAAITALTASGNGLLAAGMSDGQLKVWNLDKRVELPGFAKASAGILALAFTEDGRIIGKLSDGTLMGWDVRDGKASVVLTANRALPQAAAIAAGGKSLVVSTAKDLLLSPLP